MRRCRALRQQLLQGRQVSAPRLPRLQETQGTKLPLHEVQALEDDLDGDEDDDDPLEPMALLGVQVVVDHLDQLKAVRQLLVHHLVITVKITIKDKSHDHNQG